MDTVTIMVTCEVCGCSRTVGSKGPRQGETHTEWAHRVLPQKVFSSHKMHSLLCEAEPKFTVTLTK